MQSTHRTRDQRGFSLVEAVLALALLGVLSAVIFPHLNYSSRTGDDSKARSTLAATLDTEESVLYPRLGRFATAAEVTKQDPELSVVDSTPTSPSPSTSPAQVSLASSSTAVAAAALSSDTCWLVRFDTQAPEGTHPTLFAFTTGTHPCSGQYALSLTPSASGATQDHPLSLP